VYIWIYLWICHRPNLSSFCSAALADSEVQLTPSEEQDFRKSWVAGLWGGPETVYTESDIYLL